jgi:uncharacterized coiled-coil protein SlyX
VADGFQALSENTTGVDNTATGVNALLNNTTGNNDIALAVNAGLNLTTGDSNIDIGNQGVAAEANTIRIGAGQTATFVAGINGVSASAGLPVYILSTGQLGTGPTGPTGPTGLTRTSSNQRRANASIAELKALVAKQEVALAQQQKEIKALTARVKQQESEIQAVSKRLELVTPLEVTNDR